MCIRFWGAFSVLIGVKTIEKTDQKVAAAAL